MGQQSPTPPEASQTVQIGGIPVRNIWLLMLYASRLFRYSSRAKVAIEEVPDEIPDLVAEILTHAVSRRLMRNLSFGYARRRNVLARVRGRVDLLRTERSQLLLRGKVSCVYDELTVNTARNRYVAAALIKVSKIVRRTDLAQRCRTLAASLRALGVSGEMPTRQEIGTFCFGRHDAADQVMVAAAQLAMDLALPTESLGKNRLYLPSHDVTWVRILYEKAVGGFYKIALSPEGWTVRTGEMLDWRIDEKTAGLDGILPGMKTDIVLTRCATHQRVVIDTKFTHILTKGRFGDVLRSGHLYQIYAYLRSQEGSGKPFSDVASGLLLYPAVGEMVNETVVIQGHSIRFATVDLASTPELIRKQLLLAVQCKRHVSHA